MSKQRVAISMGRELYEEIEASAAARGKPLSEWFEHAARVQLRQDEIERAHRPVYISGAKPS